MAIAGARADDGLQAIEYRDAPAVLLFGDGEAALERGRLTSRQAGCRIAVESSLEDAEARLADQIGAEAVLLEVARDHRCLDAILDRLNSAAATGRLRSVVAAPPELIDIVAARTPSIHVAHLCLPSEAERVAALAVAGARRPAMLHDIGRDGTALLHQLSEEVGRIASVLASLSEEEGAGRVSPPPLAEPGAAGEADASFVRSIIRARRLRDQFFRAGLFADPAWDMLLDLMAARLEGHKVAVSSLCIAAAVPPTTALRWIKLLTDQGLLVRVADPQDGRRVYIELSEDTACALAAYLRAVQRLGAAAI